MPNTKSLELGSTTKFNFDIGLKDGARVTADWVQALALRGRVFHAFFGSDTSPATFDTSYANTDPDISIDIPDGTAIMPLQIRTVVEAYGTQLLFETFTLCTKTLANASATAFTPINMATRQGSGSACLVNTAPTVTNGAGHVDAFEIGRETYSKAVTITDADQTSSIYPTHFSWSYQDEGFAPILHGEASMQTWVVCNAPTGYLQIWWAELTEAELKYI